MLPSQFPVRRAAGDGYGSEEERFAEVAAQAQRAQQLLDILEKRVAVEVGLGHGARLFRGALLQ